MDDTTRDAPQIAAARVLVVDDDVILGGALADLLRQKGFDVVGQASDGPAAIALARQEEPDVVLMDFRMPMMDGLEASALIQAHAPMTQTVMFTAYDDETLNVEASQSGVYCLLVKGCDPDLIVEVVERAAARKRKLETMPAAS
jgi:DNA-binding NarL/FixJ family response regulator